MKVTTFSVPIGAVLGLLISYSFADPTNITLLIGTIVGGLLGGSIGLFIKQRIK